MPQAQPPPTARRFEGRVALVTGAARGQGRAHCERLAAEGADVVAVDRCADLPGVPYALASTEDLDETVRRVEALGRRAVGVVADTRDADAMAGAVDRAVSDLGGLDVVVANAGVQQLKPALEIGPEDWEQVVGVNLTGTWTTVRAALPVLVGQGHGSVVVTSSAAAVNGPPRMAHYSASKAGVTGLMRSLAVELGPAGVRVNAVLTTTVDTSMIHWPGAYAMFRPDLEAPGRDDVDPVFRTLNKLDVPWLDPSDVAAAVAWLASDEARFVTGHSLHVDAGTTLA